MHVDLKKSNILSIAGRRWKFDAITFSELRGLQKIATPELHALNVAVSNYICNERGQLSLGDFCFLCSTTSTPYGAALEHIGSPEAAGIPNDSSWNDANLISQEASVILKTLLQDKLMLDASYGKKCVEPHKEKGTRIDIVIKVDEKQVFSVELVAESEILFKKQLVVGMLEELKMQILRGKLDGLDD